MAMFLFTTPAAREPAQPSTPVVDAIRQGAERTGTGFDYLLATAQRESALDPAARARSSSASGLFQFIEQTWLGLVKEEGPKLGLNKQASAIATRPDGTHVVPDPAARQAILSLRDDPKVSSVMAGAFTQRNRDTLAADLGRSPTAGDLYVAHFLGARGAAQLIRSAQQSPSRAAAPDFPDAAAANRSIFYDRSGRARGAGEVYALLAANHAATQMNVQASAPTTAAPAFAPDRPLAFAQSEGPAFHGLFQTDTRRGPISDAVARLWRRDDAKPETEPLGFFPKSNAAVPDMAPNPASAPVPPPASAPRAEPAPAARPAAPEASAETKGAAQAPTPLELGRFMKRRKS
jgi:hypothetical protein